MLTIKLQRTGKKHQAMFRLVVGEKRSKLAGKQVEYIGWYNPHTQTLECDKERVRHWLKQGAQTTDTVHNLLIHAGAIEGKKIPVHKSKKHTTEAAPAPATP